MKRNRSPRGKLAVFYMCIVVLLCPALQGFAQRQPDGLAEIVTAYQDVLLGRRTYVRSDDPIGGEAYFSTPPMEWYGFPLDAKYTFTRFALCDIDADGSPELILDLTDSEGYTFGYELLRYENGTVYGFGFTLRSMQAITLEGDIATSSGAGDNGWYTLQFSADQVEYRETCRMQSTNGYAQYFIGDAEVSDTDYQSFTETLLAKPGPVWLAFTPENVDYVVSQCRADTE